MKTSAFLLAILGIGICGAASAQQVPLQPTTVQLPTFSFFTVRTTVSVPDGGGTYMGGVSRASSGSSQFGYPFLAKNRAIGSERQVAGMYVRARIHDFEEMERDLVGEAPWRAGGVGPLIARAGENAPHANAAKPDDPLARQLSADQQQDPQAQQSVAEIRAQRQANQSADKGEVQLLLERGDASLADGKPTVAKVFFQSALKKATAEERETIYRRLEAVQVALTAQREQPK